MNDKPVVIIGDGGHAKVVLDACRAAGLPVAGVIGLLAPSAHAFLDAPACGGEALLDDPAFIAAHHFLIGVGLQDVRRKLQARLDRAGAILATVIHPAAIVSPYANLGAGGFAAAGAVINAGADIGRSAILNTGCSVDHDARLGDLCQVGPGARLTGGASCGDCVVIGAGAVILPKITLGPGAVVGAGAIVIDDAPANATLVGNPARIVLKPSL